VNNLLNTMESCHVINPNCIGNKMKHTQEYNREHSNTLKNQILIMNKRVEYCRK
jgi:hypothetical protein